MIAGNYGFGYILGDFFKNASGHPAADQHLLYNDNILDRAEKNFFVSTFMISGNNGFGYILGEFFKNSSGHPATDQHLYDDDARPEQNLLLFPLL
jgi:hypothetical protein